jgi:hypothetical protein
MSYNKSLLSKITEDLAKKPKKVSVPRNQWQHPGEITNIPSGNITMDAVTYPVLGVPNIGEPQMMYPNQQYHYPGADNVTEYPMMRNGGYTVTRSNDRKGKTHKVTGPDGTVKYFGDSKLGQHPKDPERKKAFYARHKHNLDANPYFRAFARATWQNGGELDMPKMQFAGAVAASTSVQNRNRPKTPQELAAYREQIYNTIRPSDYWDQNNYARFLFNNQREEMDDVRSEEGFRQYLGLNTNPRFITPAIYRPTQAKNPNAKYYKVDKALEQDLFDSFHDKLNLGQTMGTDEFQVVNNVPYIKRLHDQGLYNEEDDTYYLTKADQKLKRSKYQSRARVLGNFTVSRGKDNKGEYLSYYDTYDFPNLVQKQMQGSPYEIYGRIYYPKKATGGQTRNEREMVNGIADILSQVKDRENRAQIAANMQADFKRDDVTYDAQKFMQMAKLQNGGGLDQYQYAGSVIDRPVIKADATSRVMPRVLTMQELQRIVENQKRKAAEEAIKKQPRIYADNVPQSTRDAWRRQQEINNYIKNSQIAQTFTSMNGGNEALGAIGAKTAAASMLGAGAAGAGVAGANWLASNVLPYVGPALSTPAAKTIGNLLSAGFATKGVMNLPTVGKSVQTAYQDPSLGNIGNAALETGVTALDLLPAMSGVKSAIGEGVSAINTSKESGLLSNAYKINPWAFKPQQGKIYRQLGQSGIDDAIQQGKVFSKGQKEFLENYPDANYLQDYQTAIDAQDSGTLYLAKPHPAPFFKRDALFFPINRTSRGKGIQSTKFSDAAYLLEGNVPEEALLPRYRHQYLRSGDVGVLRPEFNDLGNFNVYKRDWLRGYKPIEGPNVNITPAATESIPINREALKDAYGFLNRRQFVKNLQKQGLIGKGFTEADARYAARSTDKTNALTKLALDRDATFYRGVEGSVPKDGIGYQDWTGRKFNIRV